MGRCEYLTYILGSVWCYHCLKTKLHCHWRRKWLPPAATDGLFIACLSFITEALTANFILPVGQTWPPLLKHTSGELPFVWSNTEKGGHLTISSPAASSNCCLPRPVGKNTVIKQHLVVFTGLYSAFLPSQGHQGTEQLKAKHYKTTIKPI